MSPLPPPRIDLLVYSPSSSAFIAPLSLLLEPSQPLSTLLAPQLYAELQRLLSTSTPLPKTYADLLSISATLVETWSIEDQAVFLSAHPRIGETKNLSALSGAEQSGKGNDETPGFVLKRLSVSPWLFSASVHRNRVVLRGAGLSSVHIGTVASAPPSLSSWSDSFRRGFQKYNGSARVTAKLRWGLEGTRGPIGLR